MPELPILLFVAVLVGGVVLLLRREIEPPEQEEPTLDVQNHRGDDDSQRGTF